jgi:hypothetical protein
MRLINLSVLGITFIVPLSTYSADLSLTAGLFRFNATDYYFPNFYAEAGVRGEVNYRPWASPPTFRLQFYGYPGDDNIVEGVVEYDHPFAARVRGFEAAAAPQGGVALVKLQYPAPYYPVVKRQFLPWLRAGGELSVARAVGGAMRLRGAYRFRLLYYPLEDYAAFSPEFGGDPWEFLHAPYGELTFRVTDKWALLGRGGLEVGGYYDAVFLTPGYLTKIRPFGEAGVAWSF